MNVNRCLLAPIVIEIVIPIVIIVPAIFLPAAEFGPNPLDVFPALLNPSYPLYYIILSAVFVQGLLVNRYLLNVPIRKDYSSRFFRAYTQPRTYYSEYYSRYSPKRYFEHGGYEKPVSQYKFTKKVVSTAISLFIIWLAFILQAFII